MPVLPLKSIRGRYILGLSLIGALSLASYLMLRTVISRHDSSAAILNYAGKRRFLSQQAALRSLAMIAGPTPDARAFSRIELKETLDRLQAAHEGLLYGNPALGLPGNPSPALRSFYFGPASHLDALLREYLDLCRLWLETPDAQLEARRGVLDQIIQLGPHRLIEDLDRAVRIYQLETEADLSTLRNLETGVLGATFLLLLLEALLIFNPMVRAIAAGLKRIEDSNLFLRAMIDAIPDPIFVKDSEHRWLLLNDTFCQFVGKSREELLGRSDHDFFPKELADEYWARDTAVLESGRVNETVETVRDAGGLDHTVLTKKTRATDATGTQVLIGAIRDITALRQTEQDLEVARLESFQAAKMASMGEMAAGIAHEINNPLAVISMRASLLAELLAEAPAGSGFPAPPVKHSLEIIEAMIQRINKIINALRSLSRQDFHDEPETAELSKVIADALELCQDRFIRHRIRLEVDPSVEGISMRCHPGQIQQVILNLTNNSVDAVQALGERWIRIAAQRADGQLELSVTDSGNGIPPALRGKILEPFFTTKPSGKGTGLGLSISRKLVERQGGKLYLEPSSAHTRFVIRLPLGEAPLPALTPDHL